MANLIANAVAPDAEGMVLVQLPSGATFPVHEDEVDYFNERVDLYGAQNHFVNITDNQDLDRVLILELFVYRWGKWLSRGRDYWGDPVDGDKTQKSISSWSTELRQVKKQLGLDKATRDKEKGDDSVAAYLQNLLVRAREFGVMREQQLAKAIELFQQLQSLVTLYNNCDETERREMHVTMADVFEWMEQVAFPEFNEVDSYFRSHSQKMWVRSQ